MPRGKHGVFKQVREIIDRAKAQGCREIRANAWIITPFGKRQVRYLLNPLTNDVYDLTELEDDEYMSPWTIEAAERRLGVKLT